MTHDARPHDAKTDDATADGPSADNDCDRTEIAIAVVRDGDRVLIGRRGEDGPLAGFWEFPGGKLEAEETTAAAAVRECREEAGLAVTVIGTLDIIRHDYRARSAAAQLPRLPAR